MDHLPPSDAYGRVTAPERYAVVHGAADRLIADLVTRYDVATSPGDRTELDRSGGIELLRVVRLVPSREDAAPLTIGFTAFPGVLVRFGRWHIQAFPSCGCDACDEHPPDVIRELDDHVTALVDGRLTEELTGWWRPWQTAGEGGLVVWSAGSRESSLRFVEAEWPHAARRPGAPLVTELSRDSCRLDIGVTATPVRCVRREALGC